MRELAAAVADLAAPVECAGCGAAKVRWCRNCSDTLAGVPLRVRTRADLGVPVWALARYGGPPARAVSAFKDRGRDELALVFGAALAVAVDALRAAGEIAEAGERPVVLIPVPATARARRRRGFDHVRSIAAALAAELAGSTPADSVALAPLLEVRGRVRDSAGLDAAARAANMAGHIRRRNPRRASNSFRATEGAPATLPELLRSRATVLLVDDVVTTGSTLVECVRAVQGGGLYVNGALCIASA